MPKMKAYASFAARLLSSLEDPKGLLEGKGEYVRHAKVRAASDIDAPAFAALLRQAVGKR